MKLFLKLLLLLNITILPALADDSPRLLQYPPNKIMGFLGLDTKSSSPNLSDGRATDLQNVQLSKTFNLKKRYGYSVINTTLDELDTDSPPVEGIFDARFSSGTNWPIVFVGGRLKYDNSGTWTNITGGATITEGQDYQWQCVMALDSAICTNDYNVPLKVSSTPSRDVLDVSDLSDALTKAKVITWFRNYLILANTVEGAAEKPTRFRWSDVGTIETYDDDNFIDIAELGGDEIVGASELYGDLYFFLKNSIYKVSLIGGDDIFSVNKVVEGIGAISRDSIQNIRLPNDQLGIVFLNENKKVYFFNGINVVDIGWPIQTDLSALNEARLQYAQSTWDETNYYLSVSGGGASSNNIVFVYQTEIGEWTQYDQVDVNAFARVKTNDLVKTYYGNYEGFVYWLDNPDNENDVDGAVGIVDSVATVNTATATGAQILIDADITTGIYTGAIVKITSGTAAGEEAVVLTSTSTGVVVVSAFSTTPDSTSNYSIGAIDAFYYTKWYDFGASSRKKNFRAAYFWSQEASNNEVTVEYAEDFGSTLGSESIDLAPSGSSVWDTALWDEGIWGSTGDKFKTVRLKGTGRFLQLKFSNSDIDETFNIYGFHLLADALDVQ